MQICLFVCLLETLQKNLHKVVHTSGGSVCHSAKPQVATIRLSTSRSKRMEHRCSKHKLVKPCSLCLPSNSSTSKSNTKGLPVQLPPNPHSPGLAGHALVLGSGPSISGNSTSVAMPASPNLLKQSSNQVFHNNLQYLNLHAWCLGVNKSKNKVSLLKWQRELLPFKGHQQDLFTKQSGPFLCQLTCQSADIMSSLCGVGVRVNNFSSKTTRPRDVLFFLKDTLSIEDEKLFKACKSVCSSVC